MMKLGFYLLCCSDVQYVDIEVKKGILSIAVFVGFSGQTTTSLVLSISGHIQDWVKIGQNCIAIFWLYDKDIQHSHPFCCICIMIKIFNIHIHFAAFVFCHIKKGFAGCEKKYMH